MPAGCDGQRGAEGPKTKNPSSLTGSKKEAKSGGHSNGKLLKGARRVSVVENKGDFTNWKKRINQVCRLFKSVKSK